MSVTIEALDKKAGFIKVKIAKFNTHVLSYNKDNGKVYVHSTTSLRELDNSALIRKFEKVLSGVPEFIEELMDEENSKYSVKISKYSSHQSFSLYSGNDCIFVSNTKVPLEQVAKTAEGIREFVNFAKEVLSEGFR